MKNKVLFLFTEVFSSFGGIQNSCRQLVRAFERIKFRCHLVILNDLKVPEGRSPKEIEVFSGRKWSFALRSLAAARAQTPDWIVLGHVHLSVLVPLLRIFSPKSRIAVVLHGVEAWYRRSLPIRWGLRLAHLITAPSNYTKAAFCRCNGFENDSVAVVPWFVEPLKEKPSYTSGGNGVLAVSRLSSADEYKGLDVLLEALAILRARGRDVPAVIVGEGELRAGLESRARVLGLHSVSFVGRVNDAILERYYEDCDTFVLPSTREGFGIVYLEAMRHGKPVICTNLGGQVDIVLHRETGLHVAPRNPADLADAIDELCMNDSLRHTFGARAAKRVEEQFSPEKFERRWADAIRF